MEEINELQDKVQDLDEFSKDYEVSVNLFTEVDYLTEFFDWFRIRKNRDAELILSPDGDFRESLREAFGYGSADVIADRTEELFGLPKRVTVFKDDAGLRDELEGPRGYAFWFFVFGIMFCEYDGFTLCFMSGTNN